MPGTIRIAILANAAGAQKAIDSTAGSTSRFGREAGKASRASSGLGGGLKSLASGFVAFQAIGKVGAFLKDATAGARENQKVSAQTNAVLKSTGGIAGVTARQIGNLSASISAKTGIDDEAIQSAGNLALTFTNLRNAAGKGNDVFNQTVKTATDMSVALGTDVKGATIQLSKALNDPTKGYSKLQRSGVSFTDSQITQIKTLQKTGDLMGAQKVILGEVRKEFGGSAAAQATTGEKLKLVYDNIKESIGTALLPVLDKLGSYLVDKLPGWFDTAKSAGSKVKAVFSDIQNALEPVINFMKKNPETVKAFAATLGILAVSVGIVSGVTAAFNAVLAANPIGIIIILIAALVAGLVYAYKNSETFRKVVDTALKGVGAAFSFMWNKVVKPILGFLLGAFAKVASLGAKMLTALSKVPGFGWAKTAAKALNAAAGAANYLKDRVNGIPKKPKVTISGDNRDALGKVGAVERAINKLTRKPRRIRIEAYYAGFVGKKPPPGVTNDKSLGGLVGGRTATDRVAAGVGAAQRVTNINVNVQATPGTDRAALGREILALTDEAQRVGA